MRRNIFKKALAGALFLGVMPAAAYDFEYEGLKYTILDKAAKTCETNGFKGPGPSLVIPETVSDGKTEYTVTKIGKNAFSDLFWLFSVTLPESLIEIGDSAFWNCDFRNEGGGRYLSYDESDRKPIKIPDNIRKIGNGAFQDAHNLIPTNLPAKATEIGDYAFYDCPVTDMTLPSALTKIGDYAFAGGTADQLQIPSSVAFIGDGAFSRMPFKQITLPPLISEISAHLFQDCEKLESVDFPSTITSIGAGAFARTRLSAIDIPDGVTHIGDSAFFNCQLTEVALPPSLKEISNCLFLFNPKLTTVSVPQSVESIGTNAFYSCRDLSRINIPDNLSSIGDFAFFQCHKLTEIVLPNSLKHLGEGTFSTCSGLTSLTIPEEMTKIPAKTLYECKNFLTLRKPSDESFPADGTLRIPEGIDSIDAEAFSYCAKIQKVVIPSSMKYLEPRAFSDCDLFNDYIVAQGNDCYKDHEGVLMTKDGSTLISFPSGRKGEYTVPEGVTIIGSCAFLSNPGIEKIRMHDGVLKIEHGAFNDCSALTEISFSNTIETIENSAFCYCNSLEELIAPASLKIVGRWAFSDCHSLKRAIFQDELLTIKKEAFMSCTSLSEVQFSKSLTTIEKYAFAYTALENIVLPASVKYVDVEAFGYIPDVEKIWIYGNFNRIYLDMYDYKSLEAIYYLSGQPQEEGNDIYWGRLNKIPNPEYFDKVVLYVLQETYDFIKDGDINPWSYFKDIRIYDPTDDPYFVSVKGIEDDAPSGSFPTEVFTLNGVRVADSTDSLSPGVYIVRRGPKTEKILVR